MDGRNVKVRERKEASPLVTGTTCNRSANLRQS